MSLTSRGYRPSRRATLGLIGSAALCPRAILARGIERHGGTAFGTHWAITTEAHPVIPALMEDIPALFGVIDEQLSPWRPDSTISRFNAAGTGASISSGPLYDVAAASIDLAWLSEGFFDPTVGPAVARWGFGPITRGEPGGWQTLIGGDNVLTKQRADLTLDLCGIAKGWALDRAAALVRASSVENALLDLGGEFIAIGQHPGGRPWRLGIESPGSVAQSPVTLALPPGSAVATSGTGKQSYRFENRLFSHIVDPATVAPTDVGLSSVTVVTDDATTADGWATALCAAGPARGAVIAENNDIPALFLTEEQGRVIERRSGRISDFIM